VPANLWLCGPPGAGKTSVAPLLAALRGLDAVDIDRLVENEAGLRIVEIVDQDGEPAFRARERAAIARVATRGGTVVALGGGALEDEENRRTIASSGMLIFLDASLETCSLRTSREGGARPLLREQGALARLHAGRRARYLAADVRVRVDGISPAGAADAIDRALREEIDVRVNAAKPYDVAIGRDLIDRLPRRAHPEPGGRVLVVVDRCVRDLADRVRRAYDDAGVTASVLEVEADESLKALDAVAGLWDAFAAAKLDRRGIVIGIGGGTIGDAVGFAAATFQRGIPFVAVPTTLLSAVDAAIGGKTAINLSAGKNLVGTVTQPALVAIVPQVLRRLPRRDVVSGYGEMLKYGLALDATLYRALREGEQALLDDPASALHAIARCVELKAEIVALDEEDRSGVRAILNFGHTVGHALEKVAGYGTLRHGEAVIVGMRAALALSVARGHLDAAAATEPDAHLAALPVPDGWRDLDPLAVVAATANDKKRHAHGTQFVLLEDIGSSRLDDGVTPDDVRTALAGIGLG
jgi:shikimate kinase/3-dehydroquinate synthase